MLEARIAPLEEKLRNATVIDQKAIDAGTVSVGTKVWVKDQKSGQSVMYHIVGSAEADPSENKLSNESPVGSALLGPQARRDRHRPGPPRPRAEAEDHEDRSRLALEAPVRTSADRIGPETAHRSAPGGICTRLTREYARTVPPTHNCPEGGGEDRLIEERRAKLAELRDARRRSVPARVPRPHPGRRGARAPRRAAGRGGDRGHTSGSPAA